MHLSRSRSPLRLVLTLVAGCALFACRSTGTGELDTALLVDVPEETRARIDEARLEIGRRADDIARAEREIELRRGELDVLEKEHDAAEARVEQAEASVELAIEQGDAVVEPDMDRTDVVEAKAFRRWVDARIAKQEARIDQARADLERARAREELAKAHLQLLQARALEDLGRPDTADIDIDAYQRRVDELELEVGDAQIAYESAERRSELRDEIVADRAEAVPARFRTSSEEEGAAREAAAERDEEDERQDD